MRLLPIVLAFIAVSGTPARAEHPRLIVRASDVDRLRSWATPSNPMWKDGLKPLAANAKRNMNKGLVDQDTGATAYDPYPHELYAELFAFMSLVDPSPKARADYGKRARKLLMAALKQAAKGPKANKPFRDPLFSTGDRSRFYGEGFPLTVDWAYPYFSAADKRVIRKVFVRWTREQFKGYPMPILTGALPANSAVNAPELLSDTRNVRWSLNNYYLAHARQAGLMAMALDDSGPLHDQLAHVNGTFMFVIDNALRTQAPGGLSPEGFEYGPDATGRLAQFEIAMRTAGEPGPRIADNPFWSDEFVAYLESLPPTPTAATGAQSYLRQIWQAASFGDEESYWALDPISLFALLGLEARERGDDATLNAVRWIASNVPPGGKDALLDRVGNTDSFFGSILYFLTFDPGAPEPTDPRAALPTTYVDAGLNRTLSRTCWCDQARMFAHKLSWNNIDHEVGDGNDFAFLRNGEWLTKNRAGYDSHQTEPLNIVTVENDKPDHNVGYTHDIYTHGNQWILVPSGDPKLVARSEGDGYLAITGDATNLYNSEYEKATDVLHVSRSIVWLKPDRIVVYDRTTTKTAGRFKRFWLQTATDPAIDGHRATVQTPKGQQLFLTNLLPENAELSATKHNKKIGTPALGEPMKYHLKVEAPGGPADVRFLDVLQGADGGAAADPVARVKSTAGAAYDGAVIADTAVLFPVAMDGGGATTVALSGAVKRALVTGLKPGATYTATLTGTTLTVTEGGALTADAGGVLSVNP